MYARAPERALPALVLLAVGCASNPAPPAWRPDMQAALRTVHGAFSRTELVGGAVVTGELLAVEPGAVVVNDWAGPQRIAARCVVRLRLIEFDAPQWQVLTWGGLGTLSTISHGGFLVLSAPVWVATTVVSAYVLQRGAGDETFEGAETLFGALRWARFPQGLPPGFFEKAGGRQDLDPECKPLRTRS